MAVVKVIRPLPLDDNSIVAPGARLFVTDDNARALIAAGMVEAVDDCFYDRETRVLAPRKVQAFVDEPQGTISNGADRIYRTIH